MIGALAQIFVYSMSIDELPEKTSANGNGGPLSGSKAMDSLNKLITSVENYFHPSNYGNWSAPVSLLNFRISCHTDILI